MLDKILVKEIVAPIIIILLAILIYNVASDILKKFFYSKANRIDEKRKKTLLQLSRNIVRILIIILASLFILEVYGIDTKTLIASLSVIGVVLGLAFQDLLKDFIAGISIVIEGQYRVGDIVTINGFKGEVIAVGLKSTKLKAYTGEIMILANRLITDVINYNLSNSLAIVDIDVAYESDIEKVESVLKSLSERLSGELPFLKGNVELLGINSLEASSIRFRMTAATESMKHFEVQRKMLKAIKLELDKQKIVIPYNQVVIHNG